MWISLLPWNFPFLFLRHPSITITLYSDHCVGGCWLSSPSSNRLYCSERDWSRITAVTTSRSPQNISLWLLRWCEWLQVGRDRKRWDRIASQLHWIWLAWHGSDFVILSIWALSRIVSTEVTTTRDPQFSLTFRLPSRYGGKPVYIGFPEPNPHGDQFNFLFFSVIAGLVFLIPIYLLAITDDHILPHN